MLQNQEYNAMKYTKPCKPLRFRSQQPEDESPNRSY